MYFLFFFFLVVCYITNLIRIRQDLFFCIFSKVSPHASGFIPWSPTLTSSLFEIVFQVKYSWVLDCFKRTHFAGDWFQESPHSDNGVMNRWWINILSLQWLLTEQHVGSLLLFTVNLVPFGLSKPDSFGHNLQNMHNGYPRENLVRFLKARDGNVSNAHKMVCSDFFILFYFLLLLLFTRFLTVSRSYFSLLNA